MYFKQKQQQDLRHLIWMREPTGIVSIFRQSKSLMVGQDSPPNTMPRIALGASEGSEDSSHHATQPKRPSLASILIGLRRSRGSSSKDSVAVLDARLKAYHQSTDSALSHRRHLADFCLNTRVNCANYEQSRDFKHDSCLR